MLHWLETVIFSIILVLTIYGFFQPLLLRYRLIRLAGPTKRSDNPIKRFINAVVSFFLLTCSFKRERVFTGFFHLFILYGSLTFDTVSLNHILEGFKENLNLFGHGTLRSIHSFTADFLAVMVLVATLFFIVRRYVVRPDSYTYPSKESALIYTLLITVTLTFLLYEGALIAHKPDHAYGAFLGKEIAAWMGGVLPVGMNLVKTTWWIHILNVFLFALYVPRSKYLHMIFGPINIFLQDPRAKNAIPPMDIENAETFGAVQITDFNWKDMLDGFACMECGRCNDYCPANQSEKPLSPKDLVLKIKKFLLAEKKALLEGGAKEPAPLMAGTYEEGEIWTCTTCGACMHVCPVKNEHLPKIFGLRQSQTLMEAKFPPELNQFFKNMENNSNPWGFGAASRGDWAEDLDIPTLAQNADVDLLYWVGCSGSFDERSKKVTLAMVKILKKAGIRFGILGREENCCGDQARRLGNEYMFQSMAQQNIETFRKYGVKKILVTCPHGYNTFKNEYPEFARTLGIADLGIEVIHHGEFIDGLIKTGKIRIERPLDGALTFHDPCYLGRHNHVLRPPREALAGAGASLKEMKNNRYHSFCCGAGGGLMWTEENLGKRVNLMRTEEALQTGTDTVCTACPFCMTMLEDGIKDKEKDEECRVADIAEIVAQCLE